MKPLEALIVDKKWIDYDNLQLINHTRIEKYV